MLVINRSAPPDVLDDVSCADTMFSILEAAFGFGFWLQVWFVKVVPTARARGGGVLLIKRLDL